MSPTKHTALLLLALGWATPAFAAEPASGPIQKAVERLMACDDCKDGEQQAVVKLGAAAVPALAQALREGPPAADRARVQRELRAAYQQLVAYHKRNPRVQVGLSEDEYVRLYSENLAARHAVRAATALGAIGGPAARKELNDALARPLRPDVKAVLQKALKAKDAR